MNWDLKVLPPALNSMPLKDVLPIFKGLLGLGEAVFQRYRPLSDSDKNVVCFGLCTLAVRQAKAVDVLLRSKLDDQAVTVARSLYETLVNLVAALKLELLDKVGQYAELPDEQVEASCKRFLDFHRAVNQSFLETLEKQSQDLLEAKRNKRSRKPDGVILGELEKWISTHKESIESEYRSYAVEYSREKAPQYWNSKNPIEAAGQSGISLPQLYAWCCIFSHSNAYALRLILQRDVKKERYSPRLWADFKQGIVFFCTWSLANCLGICFKKLDGFKTEEIRLAKIIGPLVSP